MTKTIDTIVTEVFANLRETREGQTRVDGTDWVVNRLNAAAAALRERRAQLRPRPGMSFSVNTTQAQRDPLTSPYAFTELTAASSPSRRLGGCLSQARTSKNSGILTRGHPNRVLSSGANRVSLRLSRFAATRPTLRTVRPPRVEHPRIVVPSDEGGEGRRPES